MNGWMIARDLISYLAWKLHQLKSASAKKDDLCPTPRLILIHIPENSPLLLSQANSSFSTCMDLCYFSSCGVCVCLIFVSLKKKKVTYLTPWAAYEFIRGRKQMFSRLNPDWETLGMVSLWWGGRPMQGWSPKECHVKPGGNNFSRTAWEILHCLILKNATIHRSCGCLLPPREKSVTVLEPWLWFFGLPLWWPSCLLETPFSVHPSLSRNDIPSLSAKLPFQE